MPAALANACLASLPIVMWGGNTLLMIRVMAAWKMGERVGEKVTLLLPGAMEVVEDELVQALPVPPAVQKRLHVGEVLSGHRQNQVSRPALVFLRVNHGPLDSIDQKGL